MDCYLDEEKDLQLIRKQYWKILRTLFVRILIGFSFLFHGTWLLPSMEMHEVVRVPPQAPRDHHELQTHIYRCSRVS
jgi:hypothetical protein